MIPDPDLSPYFLGAHGEQDKLFEELLVTHLRGHFEWRRSFHPEDVATPPTGPDDATAQAFAQRTRTELLRLTEALKRSVPVSSPRYVGHMTSDLLLPGVLAQMVTTLYNPNNVSTEVAPVTVGMERAAAAQLAAMVGYETDANAAHRAWGHLTGGGTVANIEALWIARAVRCWPLAVLRAAQTPACPGLAEIAPPNEWAALNLSSDRIRALQASVTGWLARLPVPQQRDATAAIEAERIEQRGAATFPALHVLVPETAHYSWNKAVQLLGIGTDHLHPLPVDAQMRMDASALAECLDALAANGQVTLAVVPVLGTTEFGTIDPLHEICTIRDQRAVVGQGFWVHTDAAWGGYLASMFRDEDGGIRGHEVMRGRFKYFPSRPVYDAFAALGQSDSITVDPHKLGYIPFGVGALLLRDGRDRAFVSQRAPYVFDESQEDVPGRYALEGSRAGAMAAAVCVAHRTLPLHAGAFGRLPANSIRANERLWDRLGELRERLSDVATLSVPFEPDTNLVCIAINPVGNTKLSVMNRFMESVYTELSVDPTARRQNREFFASRTRISIPGQDDVRRSHLFGPLGLEDADEPSMFLLRHTLMNPWLFAGDGKYIDRYCDYLAGLVTSQANEVGPTVTY